MPNGQPSAASFGPRMDAISYGLMNLGQQLAQAGAPSPYKQNVFGGLAQGAQGYAQGLNQYRDIAAQDELLQLQKEEATQKRKKLEFETKKHEQDAADAAAKRDTLMRMAQTPPKTWTGDMQSWQNLVLTDVDSAAKWYEPNELETITEYQGGQQRTAFYDPRTGETVRTGEWSPRWAPTQAAQPTEFSAWLEAFKRDQGRNPTAKEIADRDKRLSDAIEYKNVLINGQVKTLPVGPDLDAAIQQGGVITGTTTQLTEAQGKAGMQFAVSRQANERLDKVEQVLTSPSDFIASKFGTVGNYAKSDEYRQAEQAARAMAEAYLRAITGAAATQPEIERVTITILPQPGDDPGTIAQKKATRNTIVETLRLQSGSMAGQMDALQPQGGTSTSTEDDPLGIR